MAEGNKEKPLEQVLDWVVPLVLAVVAGEAGPELRSVADRFARWSRVFRRQLEELYRRDVARVTAKVRYKFVVWQLALVVLAEIIAIKATGYCGPVSLEWWVRAMPLIPLFWLVPSLMRASKDRDIPHLPAHIANGRARHPKPFREFTTGPDGEREREIAAAGLRSVDSLRTEAEIQNDPSLDDTQRTAALAERRREADAIEREHRDFIRVLEAGPPIAPFLTERELAQARADFGSMSDSDPLDHVFALLTEPLYTTLALFAATIALGSHGFSMGGVNLVFPLLLGLLTTAARILFRAGYALTVELGLLGAETAATAPARPTTALYHLILRALPGVTESTVEAQFGRYMGLAFARARAFVETWSRRPLAQFELFIAIAVIFPHWGVVIGALVLAIAVGATDRGQEAEGIDIAPKRRAAAMRIAWLVLAAVILELSLLFLALFAREWLGTFLDAVIRHVNLVLHFGYRDPEQFKEPHLSEAWAKQIGALALLVGVAFEASHRASKKDAGVWTRRASFAAVVLVLLYGANTFFGIPEASADALGVRGFLRCPGEPPASAIATNRDPAPAPRPVPPVVVPPPPPIPPPAPVVAAQPPSPPVRHRRHDTAAAAVEGADDCAPAPGAIACDQISNHFEREELRAVCGCR